MATNFVGLFFLVLAIAGLSNAASPRVFFDNRDFVPQRHNPFIIKNMRERIENLCREKYGPLRCTTVVYNPLEFRVDVYPDLKPYRKPSSYFRRSWSIEEPPYRKLEKWILKDRISNTKSKYEENSVENIDSDSSDVSSENGISFPLVGGSSEIQETEGQNPFKYTREVLSSDISGNSTQSDVYSSPDILYTSSATNFEPDFYATGQKISDFKILYESITDIPATETTSNLNTLRTTQGTSLIVSESKKIFEKGSTEFSYPSSIITRKVSPLDDISSSPKNIQSTNNQDLKLETTISQSQSFFTVDEEIPIKIKSTSSDEINFSNTQNFETAPIAFKSSTSDDIVLPSKLSSSFEIKASTGKTFETESTTENYISTKKVTSIPFTNEVTQVSKKETYFTESPSTETAFPSGGIPKDHIIEISSIRTARIVITSVFLVLALIAVTVFAVYIFRLRRKEIYYDQLLLIP